MENFDIQYQNYAVVLLDLLGQKHLLSELPDLEMKPPKEKVLEALKKTAGIVLDVRRNFVQYFKSFADRPLPDDIPREFEEELLKARKINVNAFAFSDTIVASTPVVLHESKTHWPEVTNSIYVMLYTTAQIVPYYLSLGHPIRGAIDVGPGVRLDSDSIEIYGKVLNSVVALEKEAAHPRILVGPGLLKFLNYMCSISENSAHERISRATAQNCLKLITIDFDGKKIVHYLGEGMREIMLSDKDLMKLVQDIHFKAVRYIDSQLSHDEEKIRNRYEQLKEYFDKHLPQLNI